jgi:putative endonuclease
MKNSSTGRHGEKLAQEYLKEHGDDIVENNYRSPDGEVDIIASKDNFLSFVEVRTRSTRKFGTPEESITRRKKQKLIAVSQHYLQKHDIQTVSWRIDFIAVELDGTGRPTRIEHFENAFGEEYNPAV